MRFASGLALLFLVLSSVHGQTFPAPITPERAVSAIVRTGAAGTQSNSHIATNGDIALVAWVDNRDGSTAVYCARVDTAGNVLDLLGVRVTTGYWLYSVAWNGESFVVIVGSTFTLVSPDLTTITTKQLALGPNSFFIAATTGADPRFLFFEGAGTAAVVDARGNVVIEEQLDAAKGGSVLAGGNETSFLLLRNGLAHHIDRDGNVLSIVDANIGTLGIRQFGTLAGGPDGFLLAGFQGPENQPEVAVHWFTLAGVLTSSRVLGKVGSSQFPAALGVVREANRYVVAWILNDFITSNASEFAASVGVDNGHGQRRRQHGHPAGSRIRARHCLGTRRALRGHERPR